jgi:AraC-like DNA-binding protein
VSAEPGETNTKQPLGKAETSERYLLDPGLRLLLADLGISTGNVLRRAHLPADLFARDQAKLTTDDYYALWQALGDESGDPNLPIRIGNAISVEAFSPPIFAALCSANLEVAAKRIATYKKLVGPMRLSVSRSGTDVTLRFDWRSQATPPQVLATSELVFWVALARIGTRTRLRPLRATSPQPPADNAPIREYFGCEIDTGRSQTIVFATDDASRPFLTANERMWEFFEPELRRRLDQLDRESSTADRVQAALFELLPTGSSGIGDVARSLAVSTRTLQRRLREEGTNYQATLNTTRESLAHHYLSDETLTVGQISFLLGYETPSSFYRAFHAWTGRTPETARTSH